MTSSDVSLPLGFREAFYNHQGRFSITRQHVRLREAAHALGPPDAPRRTSKRAPTDEQRRQSRRAIRKARYDTVVALYQEGLSAHQIAAEVGVARATVHRYVRAACFPERMPPLRPRQIDPYIPYLQERWNAGEHNARTLWRAIHAQGYRASEAQVRRLVYAWRTPPEAPGVAGHTRSDTISHVNKQGLPSLGSGPSLSFITSRSPLLVLVPPASKMPDLVAARSHRQR